MAIGEYLEVGLGGDLEVGLGVGSGLEVGLGCDEGTPLAPLGQADNHPVQAVLAEVVERRDRQVAYRVWAVVDQVYRENWNRSSASNRHRLAVAVQVGPLDPLERI